MLTEKKRILSVYIERLQGLSPLDKLQQGFSFVEDATGKPVYDIRQVSEGDRVQIHVKNGRILAAVEGKEAKQWK